MKILKIIPLLLLFICCKNNSDRKIEPLNIETEVENGMSLNKSMFFPFEFKLSDFKRDSINEYGAGDCWGNVQQFSKNKNKIGLDSLNCGDYGFYHSFYFLKNGKIELAHLKESKTIIGDSIKKIQYALIEKIYDYREKPYLLYSRTDTLNKPNLELIKTVFTKDEIRDFQTTYEHLMMGYKSSWKTENDR